MEMKNPHNMPEAHVLFKDGYTTAKDGAQYCGGNCYFCCQNGIGCWNLKKGQQVIFKEH